MYARVRESPKDVKSMQHPQQLGACLMRVQGKKKERSLSIRNAYYIFLTANSQGQAYNFSMLETTCVFTAFLVNSHN